jgi:ADP-heptose:LPS heptosyltransferase
LTKILIVRLGSLGDIIHAIPAAAAIRRAYPDATIDWLVDARHAEVLDLVPVVSRKIAVQTSSASSMWSALAGLRRTRYDAALDLQGLLKSAGLARLSGAARVIGFPADLLRERAARVFYTENAGEGGSHVINKNLSMLTAIGVRVPGSVLGLATPVPSCSSIPVRLGRISGGHLYILPSSQRSSRSVTVCARWSYGDLGKNSSLVRWQWRRITRPSSLPRRPSPI